MYNSKKPDQSELPTTAQLIRSTFLAGGAAVIILFGAVLPAEYAIDPTGIGRVLGLTRMGEIKVQLASEADRDAKLAETSAPMSPNVVEAAKPTPDVAARSDQISVTLKPGAGAEVKLKMKQGARAQFSWRVDGGVVNYDLHGDGVGNSKSYQRGKGAADHKGDFEAAFDGSHGWFWRNRGDKDVTVTLNTSGEYAEIRRVI